MPRFIQGRTLFVSQYGDLFYASSVKELREQVSGACSPMYRDQKDGTVLQVGYVVGQLWLTAYRPAAVPVNR